MIDTNDRRNEVKIILSNIKNGIFNDFNEFGRLDESKGMKQLV